MNKILLASLALILTGFGCATVPVKPSNPTPIPKPTTQAYTNGTYGFTFNHPKEMVFVAPTYANLEDKIVQLQIPQKKYPKTNFGDGAFSVSAVYAKTLADCLKTPGNETSNSFKNKTTINGVEFYTATSTDAGLGNFYEAKLYRTLVGGQTCIELSEVVHTTNIYNYPEGTVTAVDTKPVWEELETVAQSFKFFKE
jgi:hypothetical protein